MTLKIFRVLWFFSILGVLTFFMYTYAALPDPIVVMDDAEQISIGKEVWFYTMLFLIAIFNMFVYVIRSLHKNRPEGEPFVVWFYGLVVCLNAFFMVAVSYISLFNGGERFEYHRIGFIVYGSIGLILVWVVAGPIYLMLAKKKNSIKA